MTAGRDWRPDFPGRFPVLGEYNNQETMDREIAVAARHGVDFIAWNEFGEGGIVAPTRGENAMKLEGIRDVFGLPERASIPNTSRPRLWLIGDSTVRNGRSDGAGGLWGWGDWLASHFDTNKLQIVNRALGGRSSRTFLTEGLWAKVVAELRDCKLKEFLTTVTRN